MDKDAILESFNNNGEFGELLTSAIQYLAEFPNDPDILFALGKATYLQGKWTQAATYLETLSVITDKDAWVMFALGDTLFHLRQYEKAQNFLQRSVDLNPRDFHARRRLADVAMGSENWSAAANILAEAATVNTFDPDLLYYLGVAQYRAGDHCSAMKAWDRMAQHPRNGVARRLDKSVPLAPVNIAERKILSQNGEDGIILRLFSEIGFESRRFVEIGFHPREANCLAIALLEGLSGSFIDGDSMVCAQARLRFQSILRPDLSVINQFLNTTNINGVIRATKMDGAIEILSIDIDGNDYWIWDAIECVTPRVVIIEMNVHAGPSLSITMPYRADFIWQKNAISGASLRALTKLGSKKGYSLIGCNATGVNAFFLRSNIKSTSFPPLTIEEAYSPFLHLARPERDFDLSKWQEV
jgi:tetratricopeptide (TPR) repeat protein